MSSSDKLPNPYNYNMPATESMFFGRVDEEARILNDLTSVPGDSCAIIGGRRIGKTSLLEKLFDSLEQEQHNAKNRLLIFPVLIDASLEVKGSPFSLFVYVLRHMTDMFGEYADSTDLKRYRIDDEERSAIVLRDFLVFAGRIAMSKTGRILRVVVLLDECEHLVNKSWSSDFYDLQRSIIVGRATRNHYKLVMAGSNRFLTEVNQAGSPLHNILNFCMLYALPKEPAINLITTPVKQLLPSEVVERIMGYSGKHPFLIQYLMHSLWDAGFKEVTNEQIHSLCLDFWRERNDFHNWCNTLQESSLEIYDFLSGSEPSLGLMDIATSLDKSPVELIGLLDELCYFGLIEKNIENDKYEVTCQMFREWFENEYSAPAGSKNIIKELETKPLEIFYSYSHADEDLRDMLEKHLSILAKQQIIRSWHDRRITSGEEWKGEIDSHLESADIILLLVSSDFLSSNYCYDIELKRALERHEGGEAKVIPVILRAVDWKGAKFGKLQALPNNAKAITSWDNKDEAFTNVAEGIRDAINKYFQTDNWSNE